MPSVRDEALTRRATESCSANTRLGHAARIGSILVALNIKERRRAGFKLWPRFHERDAWTERSLLLDGESIPSRELFIAVIHSLRQDGYDRLLTRGDEYIRHERLSLHRDGLVRPGVPALTRVAPE